MEFKQSNLLSLYLSYFTLAIYFGTGPTDAFYIDHRQSPATHDWSYNNQLDWRAEHKQCGLKVQSPIDIQRRYVIQSNLSISFYNYNQLTRFKISNAHHTIKLNPINNFQESLFGIKLGKHNQNDSDGDNSSSLPDVISVDEEAEAAADFTARNGGDIMLPVPKRAALLERIRNIQAERSSQAGANKPLDGNSLGHEEQHSSDGPAFNGAPTIKLSWLDEANSEFKLRDIHFHWGERRDNGSEHAIDGRRAAMEMHLVHIKHGLDKSKIGITSDSVTVIAVLIESYRKSNADFNPIVNALTRINMTNEVQEIEYKSINDLLPNTLSSFYAYSGSLTTPPCYQVVNWIVMSDRLYLNAKQIEMFRSLYAPPSSSGETEANQSHSDHDGKDLALIMPNTRHIQPLNNRTIMASFASLNRLEQIQVVGAPYSGAASVFYLQNNYMQFIYQLISAAFLLTNLLKIDKIICYTTSLIYDVNCASGSSRKTTTT